jgi:hypothetical protein
MQTELSEKATVARIVNEGWNGFLKSYCNDPGPVQSISILYERYSKYLVDNWNIYTCLCEIENTRVAAYYILEVIAYDLEKVTMFRLGLEICDAN